VPSLHPSRPASFLAIIVDRGPNFDNPAQYCPQIARTQLSGTPHVTLSIAA
jgi:hypothetical protein